jgi:hypothetical protein
MENFLDGVIPEASVTTKSQMIMEALSTGSLTEKAILTKVGDSRYTREIVRNLLHNGKIYRFGKGGAANPFRLI